MSRVLCVQGSEVLSMLYAAHQEGKKTTGVDVEVDVLTFLLTPISVIN